MSVHLIGPDGRPKCEAMVRRDGMTDSEFWEDVFHPDGVPDFDIPEDDLPETALGSPCPECGQVGACSYDAEGRAMIHVVQEDDG